MREKRAALAMKPSLVEDVLAGGAKRARAIAAPILAAAREVSGLGPAR